jgi:hypothetical protein
MKLFVSDRKVQDAVIPIRWCLSKKELKRLEECGAKNPHLLLITVYKNREIDRYLIPLSQMLAYVQFRRPGKNRIFATVVWERYGKVDKLKKSFLARGSRGFYMQGVLDYEGNFFPSFDCPRLEQEVEMNVMVPNELFAKEPPAWEKWWVNLWFETKPRDQCQFRRRRMLAYSVQPLAILLFVIAITIFRALAAGALLLFGKRGVDFDAVMHPFKYGSVDVWCDVKTSVFLENVKGESRPWSLVLFMPVFFLGFLAALIGVRFIFPSLVSGFTLYWWHYPLVALMIWMGIIVAIHLLFAFFLILCSLFRLTPRKFKDSIKKFWEGRIEAIRESAEKKELKAKEKRRRKQEEQRIELQELLVCNGDFTPELSALPKNKQTIYLRFQNLKAKVCKPFVS